MGSRPKRYLSCFILSVLLASISFGQVERNEPEVGYYDSYISSIGIRTVTQNSLMQGWSLQNVPTLDLIPSLLGQLHLMADGTYEMPSLNVSGTWEYQPTSQSIRFSGELSDQKNYCSVTGDYYIIQFQYLDNDDLINYVQYQKMAENPIPDLVRPNGDFTGKIRYFWNGVIKEVDVSSGTMSDLFHTDAPGWGGDDGSSVHIHRINPSDSYEKYPEIRIYNSQGGLIESMQGMTRNPKSWINKYYWLGDYNASCELLLINGYSIQEALDNTVEKTPGFSIINKEGEELLYRPNERSYTASWLGHDQIIYGERDGRIMKYDLETDSSSLITTFLAKDLVVDPTATKLLIKTEENLHIYHLNTDDSEIIKCQGEDLALGEWTIPIIRWGPSGNEIAVAVKANSIPEYAFFMVATDGSDARPLLNEQGGLVLCRSPFFSWIETN